MHLLSHIQGSKLSHDGLGRRTQIASQASDFGPPTTTGPGPWRHNDHAARFTPRNPFSERGSVLIEAEVRTKKKTRSTANLQSTNSAPRPCWGHVAARSHHAACCLSCCRLLSLVGSLSGNGCVLLFASALRWCWRFGGSFLG